MSDLEPGWLRRQADKIDAEIEAWPYWMKRNAGIKTMTNNQKETPMPRMIDVDKLVDAIGKMEGYDKDAVLVEKRLILSLIQHQASAVPSGVGEHERLIQNLTMLVRRMAHRLSLRDDGKAMALQACEFLARHNLQGSPLRTPPATERQPARAEEDGGVVDVYLHNETRNVLIRIQEFARAFDRKQEYPFLQSLASDAKSLSARFPYLTSPATEQQTAPLDLGSAELRQVVARNLCRNAGHEWDAANVNKAVWLDRADASLQAIRDFQAKEPPMAEESESSSMPRCWMGMETAPRDGTSILAFMPWETHPLGGTTHTCVWDDDRYSSKPRPFWRYPAWRSTESRLRQPKYWMPLPPPPSIDQFGDQ